MEPLELCFTYHPSVEHCNGDVAPLAEVLDVPLLRGVRSLEIELFLSFGVLDLEKVLLANFVNGEGV